jgi:phenylpropionate dioxygenase-like ring-hydroxylating dioxygenase large terminal subunit
MKTVLAKMADLSGFDAVSENFFRMLDVDERRLTWPEEGNRRVPYSVFSDPAIFAEENERVFRGPTWNFLGLEAEIPKPGDVKATQVAATPVLMIRTADGRITAMVNRCAHKGALLCVEPFANRTNLTCVYHAWSFDLDGNLRGIPFRNGVAGKGGMPAAFDTADHGLQRLRVETICGLVFGTFSAETEPLEDYLGTLMAANIRRVLDRPIQVLGYQHQVMHGNWKLYMENARDPYHATILHAFYPTFKLNKLNMDGGIQLDDVGRHAITYSKAASDTAGAYEGGDLRSMISDFGLADPSVISWKWERPDGISLAVQSIFPSFVLHQIYNSLAVRQLVPITPDKCELHWTLFGYADDDDELRAIRRRQANLVGSAGYISMEDGAVVSFVQRGVAGDGEAESVIELGGYDVATSEGVRATETSVRGFWNGYRALMGFD